MVASAALWALGWTVTTLAGIDVERQYMAFGASGALVYSLCSGALLARLLGAQSGGIRRYGSAKVTICSKAGAATSPP
jgi:hypothetical protein